MDQEGKTTASSRSISLPYDVVATDILPRVAAKSLARFRCVCKLWRSLTYDPRFAMAQSIRAADADTRLCLLPSNSSFVSVMLKAWLQHNGIDGDRKSIEEASFDCMFGNRGWYRMSNSVNGLLCALCVDDLRCYPYLFNPTTREVVQLPEISVGADVMMESLALSLGFDSSSGHYMVVLSYCIPPSDTVFYLLTVGSLVWRFLDKLPYFLRPEDAVLHDAALYWLAPLYEEDTNDYSPAVLAFDIKDEMFRFIRTPKSTSAYLVGPVKSKGHLCLVHAHHVADELSFLRISKLEDGTAPKSTGMYVMTGMAGIVDDDFHSCAPHVIGEACGQILTTFGARLYAYDEGSKTINLITELVPMGQHIDVFSPTLVSPSRLPALV